jgi:endonuclease/exonuclease/phosphatase family metal-dependent hydrolase
MLVDNLLPELKLKQSNILTMGDFNSRGSREPVIAHLVKLSRVNL